MPTGHHLSREIEEQVAARYQARDSMQAICDEFGVSRASIRRAVRACGVAMRPPGTERRFHCADDFFSCIDTEPKAYWLGFLAADGTVSDGRNCVALSLSVRDACHVEAFRTAIGGTGRVRVDKGRGWHGKEATYARFSVVSSQLVADLIRHGVTPRKTATLQWPPLAPDMYRHFLRGYFDGDGCFSTMGRGQKAMTWGIVGTEPFLLDCRSFLVESLGLSRVKLIPHRETSFIRYLNYGGTAQVCLIRDLMYEDATIWLERKRALVQNVTPERGRYGTDHCGRGHAYTPENTISLKDGYRLCKICDRVRRAKWLGANREKMRAYQRDYMREYRASRRGVREGDNHLG